MQDSRLKRRVGPFVVAAAAGLAIIAGGVAFVRAGIYNVAADDPHLPVTYAVLEQLRDASIHARAAKLDVPADLMSAERVTQGAGNYAAMCTQCHLAPGMGATELSKGLYPAPPNLTAETVGAAEAFWVIKHGIKASGMPAWGASMDDAYIWNMAAFVQRLPTLDAAEYNALVASSGGHSHGGGETTPSAGAAMPAGSDHPHPAGTPEDHHAPAPAAAGHDHPPGTPAHVAPPGKPVKSAKPAHVDPPGAAPHAH